VDSLTTGLAPFNSRERWSPETSLWAPAQMPARQLSLNSEIKR